MCVVLSWLAWPLANHKEVLICPASGPVTGFEGSSCSTRCMGYERYKPSEQAE